MESVNNKTKAIQRILDIEKVWCNDIQFNDGCFTKLLYEIASDIYEGYVTYDAFLSAIIEAAGNINFHSQNTIDSEILDRNIFLVRNEVFSKFTSAYSIPNYT